MSLVEVIESHRINLKDVNLAEVDPPDRDKGNVQSSIAEKMVETWLSRCSGVTVEQFLTKDVMNAYQNKIINLHPGLIPDDSNGVVVNPDGTKGLWNKKMFTTKALQNYLDNHATYAGSTIHFLSDEVDFGPVLGRCFEKIQNNDTVDSLYTRLKIKENQLYVMVLAKLCKEGK